MDRFTRQQASSGKRTVLPEAAGWPCSIGPVALAGARHSPQAEACTPILEGQPSALSAWFGPACIGDIPGAGGDQCTLSRFTNGRSTAAFLPDDCGHSLHRRLPTVVGKSLPASCAVISPAGTFSRPWRWLRHRQETPFCGAAAMSSSPVLTPARRKSGTAT